MWIEVLTPQQALASKPKVLRAPSALECELRIVPRGSPVTPGVTAWPHAFPFAHRSELDKEDNVGRLVSSRSPLTTKQPKIDKEINRARMLCQCCAFVETEKRKAAPGPSEEGN